MTELMNAFSYVCEHALNGQALPDSVQQLHVQQPSTYAKPDAASVVLGS